MFVNDRSGEHVNLNVHVRSVFFFIVSKRCKEGPLMYCTAEIL